MPQRMKRKKKQPDRCADDLPELLAEALSQYDDFIVTCARDPDTAQRKLHIITGKFVSRCMLRKLLGQAEAQRDEGSRAITLDWE